MDKKVIVILLLATVLAFLISWVMFKKDSKKIEQSLPVSSVQETGLELENATTETLQEVVNKDEVKPQILIKTEQKPLAKTETMKVEAPVIKPLQVEEKSVAVEVETKDVGVIKEVDSNVIVITREFKTETPTKYSFK
ncbi:hypothetical protein IJ384_03735 [bacterium]|nr:hypothetical protein [bacterium]